MSAHRRYSIYLESGAWATNLKQKLISGSPVIAVKPRFPDFFSRALHPGEHFLPLQAPPQPLPFCQSIVWLVRDWLVASYQSACAAFCCPCLPDKITNDRLYKRDSTGTRGRSSHAVCSLPCS